MTCELKLCKYGDPATVRVNENIGDASYNVGICQRCADVLGLKSGDDLPTFEEVKRGLSGVAYMSFEEGGY